MDYRHVLFFNDTATTEIYTLSLHDALPIYVGDVQQTVDAAQVDEGAEVGDVLHHALACLADLELLHEDVALRLALGLERSEEHTSELQSRSDLVCRLLLDKKAVK